MSGRLVSLLSVFASTGTLLCCALPAAVAALAGGAAVGSLLSALPWLLPLSRHKGALFAVAAALIALNGTLTFRPRGTLACAVTGGKGCDEAGRFSKTMFWAALGIYAVGFLFAYALVPILRFIEG